MAAFAFCISRLRLNILPSVFGLEVKEVDPSEHTYILVPTLSLTLTNAGTVPALLFAYQGG